MNVSTITGYGGLMKNHLATCNPMAEVSAALSLAGEEVLLAIEVQPSARRDRITGFNPWRARLQIAVSAPPVDGQANSSVLDVLGEELGIPLSNLEIRSGASSRRKIIALTGLDVEIISSRLTAILEGLA